MLFIPYMPPLINKAINTVTAPIKAIGGVANDLLSSHMTYTAPPPAPMVQAPPASTTAPKVTPVPPEWSQAVKTAYQNYPTVPKGLIEAVLHQESSMGKNSANYNPSIGESAWLGGLTKTAKSELEKHGLTPDLNTQAGVINAIAGYLSLVQNRHDASGKIVRTITDPVDLYNNYYKTTAGLKLSKKQIQNFKDMVTHYAQGTGADMASTQ